MDWLVRAVGLDFSTSNQRDREEALTTYVVAKSKGAKFIRRILEA